MKLVVLATCNLAQWALDFEGNLQRIIKSIKEAKLQNARYRTGPELEISGYGCEDHFLEGDTFLHCWQCMEEILKSDVTDDILCDIGMPVSHRNVRYNCRVFVLNRKIVMIRPKVCLADDGNYRESRWFTAWPRRFQVEDYYLPGIIKRVTGQTTVPFGDGCVAVDDTVIGIETCEELFTANSPHIYLSLNGIEIISNGSGSHHQLRKLHTRIDLMRSATSKCGGIYLYANQQCCDGGRLYFDGCSMIVVNGKIVGQGSQFSMREIEVVTAIVNLEEVRQYRGGIASRGIQAANSNPVQRIHVPFRLTSNSVILPPSIPRPPKYHTAMEEIAYGPACWLWDYLRRSGMNGFFLPLSGGADSSSTATIVGIMCRMVIREISNGNTTVLEDARRIANYAKDYVPTSPKEFCNRIFVTCYMGTKHSSKETRLLAEDLTNEVGSYHISIIIDPIVEALEKVFVTQTPKPEHTTMKFKVHGGSQTENLALQNIQARSRMVMSYFLAQLSLWSRGLKGSLLVLGSANVAEALRGYFTKYDCSSADLNPIGGISKLDLRSFLLWAAEDPFVGFKTLTRVANATPTAELEPSVEGYVQKDEEDMGMTYAELERYGLLRKVDFCGPISMFAKLVNEWNHLSPAEVAEKVKLFFRHYSLNRHKLTTLTPSYHAENYSPDDNRYDLRPFLYNTKWTYQFKKMDALVAQMEAEKSGKTSQEAPYSHSGDKRKREGDGNDDLEKLEQELAIAQDRVKILQEKLNSKKQWSKY